MRGFKTSEYLSIFWKLTYVLIISIACQFCIPSILPVPHSTSIIMGLDSNFHVVMGTNKKCEYPGMCYSSICQLLNLNISYITEKYFGEPSWCFDSLPIKLDPGIYIIIASCILYMMSFCMQIILCCRHNNKHNYKDLYGEKKPWWILILTTMMCYATIMISLTYSEITKYYHPIILPICITSQIHLTLMWIELFKKHNCFSSEKISQ